LPVPTGRVIKTVDGDTITVLDSSFNQYMVRLTGIDAPESEQPFGSLSGDNLESMVFGRQVTVEYENHACYVRILGNVLIISKDTNLLQIMVGLAWHYKAYADEQSAKEQAAYAAAEIAARSNHRGLWADAHPVPVGLTQG
jgi:endonuclease YncB( thermonuclease family)